MSDWLTIQCEKRQDPQVRKFIQANHFLDFTMRRHLAKYLNLSEQSVQKWIELYENETSECSQKRGKMHGDYHAYETKILA